MCLKDFALHSELEKEKDMPKYYSSKSSKFSNKEKYDQKKPSGGNNSQQNKK